MTKRRQKSENIRKFVINQVTGHPGDLVRLVCEEFDISRQAANRHMRQLVSDGVLSAKGSTRNRQYNLMPIAEVAKIFSTAEHLQEHKVWQEYVQPLLAGVSENVIDICHYGFTEMFNNALDHSESATVSIGIEYTPVMIRMSVWDKGIGIFKKIASDLQLDDERHAILELSKGKLTTDPEKHTGEGVFFTSRMFDDYSILSGQLFFHHIESNDDWLLEGKESKSKGTYITMIIDPNSEREAKKVFDKYTTQNEPYSFSSTHVAVDLVRYGDEKLISRSQAKRLLARFECFKEVVLDFKDIKTIGPAFADEIFRVFQNQHPDIRIRWSRANKEVKNVIKRVTANE